MGILSKWFSSKPDKTIDETAAKALDASIIELEQRLAQNHNTAEVHKTLMLTYNKALKVYAHSPSYRHKVDELFVKIDNLRNVIRRNI